MKIIKKQDGWWVAGVEEYKVEGESFTECGPYQTKSDARECLEIMKKIASQQQR